MKNFWLDLKKEKKERGIVALAPMAGFTDSAFRLLAKSYGADLLYSEMASVSALRYKPEKTLEMLAFEKKERPYIVQLFGSKPEDFARASKFIERELRPDGLDLNFGCPVKKVLKQGAGAKLMSNLELSREIIISVLDNTSLPLSIKVRTEAFSVNLIDFLKNISDLPISALMIHGRSLKQLFSGPLDLELIKASRSYFSGLVLVNGGIDSLSGGRKLLALTGADGFAFGRGALGRPWVFSEKFQEIDLKQRKSLMKKNILKHLKLVQKNRGALSFNEFKGPLSYYLKDLTGISQLRSRIMSANSYQEIEEEIRKFLK